MGVGHGLRRWSPPSPSLESQRRIVVILCPCHPVGCHGDDWLLHTGVVNEGCRAVKKVALVSGEPPFRFNHSGSCCIFWKRMDPQLRGRRGWASAQEDVRRQGESERGRGAGPLPLPAQHITWMTLQNSCCRLRLCFRSRREILTLPFQRGPRGDLSCPEARGVRFLFVVCQVCHLQTAKLRDPQHQDPRAGAG